MSNMSYCKFENTFRDLEDCSQSLHDKTSESENRYRVRLIELCRDILEEVGALEEINEEELKKLGTPEDDAYEGDDDER